MRTFTVQLDDETLASLRDAEAVKRLIADQLAKQLVDRMTVEVKVAVSK